MKYQVWAEYGGCTLCLDIDGARITKCQALNSKGIPDSYFNRLAGASIDINSLEIGSEIVIFNQEWIILPFVVNNIYLTNSITWVDINRRAPAPYNHVLIAYQNKEGRKRGVSLVYPENAYHSSKRDDFIPNTLLKGEEYDEEESIVTHWAEITYPLD